MALIEFRNTATREAFQDLIKEAPPDLQQRLADLLEAVVFKDELVAYVASHIDEGH